MAISTLLHVLNHSKTKKSHQLVLLRIADHINKDGLAWPRPTTLARKTGLSRYWVIRCLAELVLVGELEIIPDGSPQGGVAYRFPPCSECQLTLQLPKSNCQLSCTHSVNSVDTEPIYNESIHCKTNADEPEERWLTYEQAVALGLTPGTRLYKKATGELPPED